MPLYKTEGIILRSRPFDEAAKLLSIFTREYGKVNVIAKGARRVKSKFGGRLEVFTRNHFLIAGGRTLDVLSQCETMDTFRRIRENMEALNAASVVVRILDFCTPLKDKNHALYSLLYHGLNLLDSGVSPDIVDLWFKVRLLFAEGLGPVLDKCVFCGKAYKGKPEKIRFSQTSGGIVCSKCFGEEPHIKMVSSKAIEAYNILRKAKKDGLAKIEFDQDVSRDIENFLRITYRDHFGEEILRCFSG